MKTLFLALLLVGATAQASEYNSPDNRNNNWNNNRNVNNNSAVGVGIANSSLNANIRNHNVNKQGQIQGQLQGQKQSQSQSANNKQFQGQSVDNAQSQSANNDGNHQNINFEDKRQAPGIGGPASGPCTGISGGLSVIGGAINFASVDAECDKREAARIAHILGEGVIAKKVLLSLDAVKAVLGEEGANSGDKVASYDDPWIAEYMK